VRLGTYSRDTLQQLRRDIGIAYDERTQGILHFYTSQKEFDAAEGPAALMRELGCDRRVISADEAVRLEPALRHIRPQRRLAATYTAEDESGDANRFARELVAALRGRRRAVPDEPHGDRAARGRRHASTMWRPPTPKGRFQRLRADAYVLAMGSLSPLLRCSRWASTCRSTRPRATR
jgi:D-amino-acid dehydrogenase